MAPRSEDLSHPYHHTKRTTTDAKKTTTRTSKRSNELLSRSQLILVFSTLGPLFQSIQVPGCTGKTQKRNQKHSRDISHRTTHLHHEKKKSKPLPSFRTVGKQTLDKQPLQYYSLFQSLPTSCLFLSNRKHSMRRLNNNFARSRADRKMQVLPLPTSSPQQCGGSERGRWHGCSSVLATESSHAQK